MKLETLQPGQIVYDVGRHKMGNTSITTVTIWNVHIIEVNVEARYVIASWNGNPRCRYSESQVKKWRAKKPMLIKTGIGQRLATREELKAAAAQKEGQ
jgi:hypothetical protein